VNCLAVSVCWAFQLALSFRVLVHQVISQSDAVKLRLLSLSLLLVHKPPPALPVPAVACCVFACHVTASCAGRLWGCFVLLCCADPLLVPAQCRSLTIREAPAALFPSHKGVQTLHNHW